MIPYPCAHQFEKFYGMNLLATQVRKTTLQLQLDPCKPTNGQKFMLKYSIYVIQHYLWPMSKSRCKVFNISQWLHVHKFIFTRSSERWPFLYIRENDR
jgi:hypothetical protein